MPMESSSTERVCWSQAAREAFRNRTSERPTAHDVWRRRRENLQARSQAKQQQKVARREKKLMRAGFEGRRDTFINGP